MAETDRRGVSDRMQQGLGLAELRQGAQEGALDRESQEYRAAMGIKPGQRDREYYGTYKPGYRNEDTGGWVPPSIPYSGYTGQPAPVAAQASPTGRRDFTKNPPTAAELEQEAELQGMTVAEVKRQLGIK